MTIRQQGGVFGRNPTFNDVGANDLTANDVTTSSLNVNGTGLIDILGVGTTSPQKPFVVSDAGNIGLEISPNDAAQGYTRVLNYNRTAGQYEPLRFEGASHRFYTGTAGSTLAGEFTSAGNLAFQSGNGIDFSATAGTGTSELFDDYEEGTWTPTVTSATGTITVVNTTGNIYTKIGRTVQVIARFGITTDASVGTSNITIGGLPYAVTTTGSGNLVGSNYSAGDFGTGGAHGHVSLSTSSISHTVRTVDISSRAATFYWIYYATYTTS